MTPTVPSAPAGPKPVTPVLMTADEFMARYENVHAELVAGVVKGLPVPGFKHGKVCLTIGRLIGNHVEAQDLGHTMGNDTWVQTGTNPDTVRGGDVLYFSYQRLPKGDVPDGILPIAPDLIVEVRSPSDLWTEVFAKVEEYLKAGTRFVVVLDPAKVAASVHRPGLSQQIFSADDTLTLADVLPGFSVPVRKLFE